MEKTVKVMSLYFQNHGFPKYGVMTSKRAQDQLCWGGGTQLRII
jgi:hypothetical protein